LIALNRRENVAVDAACRRAGLMNLKDWLAVGPSQPVSGYADSSSSVIPSGQTGSRASLTRRTASGQSASLLGGVVRLVYSPEEPGRSRHYGGRALSSFSTNERSNDARNHPDRRGRRTSCRGEQKKMWGLWD
jgi:hypothetical protein